MNRTVLTLIMSVLVGTGIAVSQQNPPDRNKRPDSVNSRRENQQDRIANGVQSGQLSAAETKRLESREASLNREVRTDRAANHGKLTAQERRQVNPQQNNVSKSIYSDKHNSAQAHFGNNEVGQRRENQQDRIANGIRNGSMTAGEAARSENHEQGINRQIGADRSANGGRAHRPGEAAD